VKASESKLMCPEGILARLSSTHELQLVTIDRTDPEEKTTADSWHILEKLIS